MISLGPLWGSLWAQHVIPGGPYLVPSPQNDPDMISWGPNMLPQGDHASLQEITQAPHQGPMGESLHLHLQLEDLSAQR